MTTFDQLLAQHRDLITARAHVWQQRNPAVDLDDLIQEGRLGLLRAAERFDAARGAKFIRVAKLWIEARMRRWCAKNRTCVTLPDFYRGGAFIFSHSLDVTPPDHDEAPINRLAASEPAPDLTEDLAAALDRLTARKRHILRRCYFDGASVKQVAAELGISHQAVTLHKRDAFTKLRRIPALSHLLHN